MGPTNRRIWLTECSPLGLDSVRKRGRSIYVILNESYMTARDRSLFLSFLFRYFSFSTTFPDCKGKGDRTAMLSSMDILRTALSSLVWPCFVAIFQQFHGVWRGLARLIMIHYSSAITWKRDRRKREGNKIEATLSRTFRVAWQSSWSAAKYIVGTDIVPQSSASKRLNITRAWQSV